MPMSDEVPGSRAKAAVVERREAWLTGQKEAFKAAVNGAPLETSLRILIGVAIDQVAGTSRCAFYLANDEGTELSHLVGMPDSYAREVEGFKIGPDSLACGLAIGTAVPVITPDVREEPRWRPWLWLAEEYDFRGCWSFPVEATGGRLIGTFAMYFQDVREPSQADLAFVHSLCAAAAIIIVSDRVQQDLRRSERQANLLLAELQHRVRNTLAVIRSIARRTAENSATVSDMVDHFQGRLDAFSRVQSALTRSADARVDLGALIEDELLAHAARDGEQVRIGGPEISLEQKAAERMSLAIHELTTNAVKHGAFTNGSGRVRVSWENRGDRLLLRWEESGVKLRSGSMKREGFGMNLLRRLLPYELNAQTKVELRPNTGLFFELDMPLGGRRDVRQMML